MLMNGHAVPNSRVCLPCDDPSVAEQADEIGAAEADLAEAPEEQAELAEDFAFANSEPGNGTIDMSVTLHRGWRSSYRKFEPENRQFSEFAPRWTKARSRWEASGVRLMPPRTRRSVPEQQALKARWKAHRRLQSAGAAAGSSGTAAASSSAAAS